jgi:NodT family efflux transporter outer membrane factor (OMF) lipoprotein
MTHRIACARPRNLNSHLWRSLVGLVGIGCLFSGCISVGPDYVRPSADVADQWIDMNDPRIKDTPAEYRDWWTVFDDPVLNALVEIAYKQNLTLRAAGIRILEARAALGISVGKQYPQMQEATGQISKINLSENVSPSGVTPTQTEFDLWQAGFDVGWELDFWGKFRRGVEAANADLGASIAGYDDVLVSLVAEVAATYVRIRTFEARLKVARDNVGIQERSFRITDVRFRNGLVTELDVQQAKANLRNTQALIPQLLARLRQSQNALSVLLGMPPRDLQDVIGGPRPIPTAPADVTVGMPAELLRRRPDIRQAEREVAAQSARIGLVKSDLYPQISLAGSFNFAAENAADVFMGNSFSGFGGPAFVWPLFNYGRIKNNVRVQDARFQQLAVKYQNTVLKAAQEVEDALVAFLRAQEEVRFLAESADASKRSVDLSLTQYREGLTDFTRVLQSEEFLVQQQDRLAETTGAIARNLIAVYKALGGGWEIRRGQEFVPLEIREAMQERTSWGGLLEAAAQEPKPVGILPGWPDW